MSSTWAPGTEIEKYRIETLLGQGATSLVYKAYDTRLKRHVALKHLTLPSSSQAPHFEQQVARFYHEAQVVASLRHPHIMQIHDVFEAEEQHYLAAELMEQSTLADYAESPETSLEALLQILIQAADGLDYAHSQGVVHRDIKPENIAVCAGDTAKIVDFGTAKSSDSLSKTLDGTILGTIGYMSPEQLINSKTSDSRTDIYAFGALMYHLLTACLPFEGEGIGGTIQKIFSEPLLLPHERVPGIPQALSAVIAQAMSRSPEDRYPSMAQLRDDLQRVMELIPGPVRALNLFQLREVAPQVYHQRPSATPFQDFALPDILTQHLCEQSTGCLFIEAQDGLQARIYLSAGQVKAVEIDKLEIESPVDRLYEASCWQTGVYYLRPTSTPAPEQAAFSYLPVDMLLEDLQDCRKRYLKVFKRYANLLHKVPTPRESALQSFAHPDSNAHLLLSACDGFSSVADFLRKVPLDRLSILSSLDQLLQERHLSLKTA